MFVFNGVKMFQMNKVSLFTLTWIFCKTSSHVCCACISHPQLAEFCLKIYIYFFSNTLVFGMDLTPNILPFYYKKINVFKLLKEIYYFWSSQTVPQQSTFLHSYSTITGQPKIFHKLLFNSYFEHLKETNSRSFLTDIEPASHKLGNSFHWR